MPPRGTASGIKRVVMLLRSYETTFDEPLLLAIASGVYLAVWDEHGGDGAIEISVGGAPVERSRASLRLPGAGGQVRTLLAFRSRHRAAGELLLERGGTPIARLFIDLTGVPDPAPLLDRLDERATARLIGFLLGVCRATFRLGGDSDFIAFCRRLLEAVPPTETIVFRPRARLDARLALYAADLPATLGAVESVHHLGEKLIRENRFRPVRVHEAGKWRLVLIADSPRHDEGGLAVLLGERGAHLATLSPPHGVPSITGFAERAPLHAAERLYVLACLGADAEREDAATAARALQLLAPEPARALADSKGPVGASLEFAASCGDVGIFLRGWLRDPHRLVAEAELVSPFGEAYIAGRWHRLARPDLGEEATMSGKYKPGFVCLAPIVEPIATLQPHLRLHLAGGAVELVPALRAREDAELRNMVLASVAPEALSDVLLAEVIAPAAAVLHRRAMARQTAPDIVAIGMPPANPAVSLLVPLYRNLSFLRLQISAFALDPEIRRDAELIYVLDSPEQRIEVEQQLRGLHALTGLSFRLVIMAANFGFAAANNTGARAARGATLMLVNSDVVPIAPGWLAALRAALAARSDTGVVGPKLLFDDGSLQHAGLTFERDFEGCWYNNHFFKGYPRDWPAAQVARAVPGVTGAAMLIPRALYEAIGGFTEDYIIGDYEDSDLCLKLRASGRTIRYEPAAELYHFERRSITLHAGYTRTSASAYNKRLHGERWAGAIADLMREFNEAAPTRWRVARGAR
jgi:GT2 family glycosyltransferase